MLINDPEWRGEAALWCGLVDTILGRVGVVSSLERESFPPALKCPSGMIGGWYQSGSERIPCVRQTGEAELHLFFWLEGKLNQCLLMLFLPLQSKQCCTEQCHIIDLLGVIGTLSEFCVRNVSLLLHLCFLCICYTHPSAGCRYTGTDLSQQKQHPA